MHPHHAPTRLVLAPLLLASIIGAAGFAAGWFARPVAQSLRHPSHEGPFAATPAKPLPAESAQDANQTRTPGQSPQEPALTALMAETRLRAWVAAGCPRGDPRDIDALIVAWSASAPRDALAFIHGAAQFRGRTRAYSIPLARIAIDALPEALDWLQRELPEPSLRRTVIDTLIQRLASASPHVAVALAVATGASPESFSRAFETLAQRDPAAALDTFRRFPAESRSRHASALVEGWMQKDPAAATAWSLSQCDQPHGPEVLRTMVNHLVARTPGNLRAVLSDPRIPESIRLMAIHRLGSSRPDVALELMPTLSPEKAAGALGSMFDSLFNEDPDAAISLGQSMIAPDRLGQSVRSVWNNWSHSDRPGALAWAATVSDPELKRQLTLEMRAQEIRRDPSAFLAGAATTPSGGDEAGLVNLAIRMLARSDPAEAARWVSAHAATVPPDQAAELSIHLMEQDAPQALAWMQGLPQGAARDTAHAAAAGLCAARRDEARLNRSLEEIADPVLQTRTRFEAYRMLRSRDAAAAGRWLDAQPLPRDVRTSWLAIAQGDESEDGCCMPLLD